MPVIQAGAASHFDIPVQNHDSKLYIRAYTSWMLNFDADQLYLKPITVNQSGKATKKPVGENFTLTLFPEGGDLIENISSRVAFKTNDQEGLPFPVKGKVTNSKGATVCNFESLHDGMGYFTLTPVANEKYVALWFDKYGLEHDSPLPAAKNQGISLRLDNSSNSIRYTLTRPENAPDNYRSLTVVAQMHQQLVYSAKINLQKKAQVSAPIYSDSLPDGVVQVTVFNAGNVPVAERIAFVNNNNYSFTTDLHAVEKKITKHFAHLSKQA